MTSGYLPEIEDFTKQQFLNRDALVALIDQIGPAILMVHSQAGAFGWPVADARPDQVKAILAVEPNGPPFYQVDFTGAPDYFKQGPLALPYGLSGSSTDLFSRGRRRERARRRAAGTGGRARSRAMSSAARARHANCPI